LSRRPFQERGAKSTDPHPPLSHAHSFALTWRCASFSPKGRERERSSFSLREKVRMRVRMIVVPADVTFEMRYI
jgi:hypothetical protein